MAVDPQAVATFKEVTQCFDDTIALRALIANNNDVESAVLAHMENPQRYNREPTPDRWDEEVWSQDRYGNNPANSNSSVPPIVVQGPDDFPRSSAPTRPPSRSSSIPMTGSQETGLVGASNDGVTTSKYFGPATRDHYPPSQWALTFNGATVSSTTSYPDVDPPLRKRAENEPVFVKPNNDLEYAPALLSILGQIPIVSKLFLEFGTVLEDYGAEPGWWKGSVIRRPLTLDLEAPNVEADRHKHTADEALQEVHRVVAFFLASHRAYYADAVFKLFEDLRNQVKFNKEPKEYLSDTAASFFCQGWTVAAQCVSDSPLPAQLFGTKVVERAEDGSQAEVSFYEWNLTMPDGFGGSNVSLYDVLDDTIWKLDSDGASSTSYWLEQAPHIFAITVANPYNGARDLNGIEVPHSIYIDRYLKENVAITKEMRSRAAVLRAEYHRIRPRMKKLVTFEHPKAKTDDVEMLFNSTVNFLKTSENGVADKDGDLPMDASASDSTNAQLLAMLDVLQARVRRKVSALEDEQNRIVKQLKEISATLTDPVAPSHVPTQRYTLTGVAVSDQDMYMRCLPNRGNEGPSWWHVQYLSSPELRRERVDENVAIEAAKWKSSKVMFVYARDEILKPIDVELPPSLQAFIDKDNETFQRELQEYESSHQLWQPPAADAPPPYNFDTNGPFVTDSVSGDPNPPHVYQADSQGYAPYPYGDLQNQTNFTKSSSATWADYYQAPAPSTEQPHGDMNSANITHAEQEMQGASVMPDGTSGSTANWTTTGPQW